MRSSQPVKEQPVVGQWVEGIDTPVVNERAVRASAGILFLAGFSAWLWSVITGDLQPTIVAQVICGVCLLLLYLETAFGICLGCVVAQRFARRKPQLCAGDTCAYTPPAKGEQHSILRD
ncbi:DUF4395 family protein [Microbacterium maritypicum]|uniref:hypothetical protein n=1 Tax=Microbacterium maritypicum TaxID=33918 RepID=UPI003D6EF1C9